MRRCISSQQAAGTRCVVCEEEENAPNETRRYVCARHFRLREMAGDGDGMAELEDGELESDQEERVQVNRDPLTVCLSLSAEHIVC